VKRKTSNVKAAVVLAAGPGTRFWPYNVVRNKAAFPIANVPLVRRLVEDLAALGVTLVVVVVGPGEASVRAALRGAPGERGLPREIVYVRQPGPEGNAAAAWLGAQNVGEDRLEGGILVVHGDLATAGENLAAMLDRFAEERPLAAALIQPLGDERPEDWIVAYPDGAILRGVEGHARDGRYRLCGVWWRIWPPWE